MVPPKMAARDARRKRKRGDAKQPPPPAGDGRMWQEGDSSDGGSPHRQRDAQETKWDRESNERHQADRTLPLGLLLDSTATGDAVFRGKCLYQSRKCENERALKRNGHAHNLCEEHRSKQNQHQRKFDSKKYARDGGGSERDSEHQDDQEDEDDDDHDALKMKQSATEEEATMATASGRTHGDKRSRAASSGKQQQAPRPRARGAEATRRRYKGAANQRAPPPQDAPLQEPVAMRRMRPPPLQVVDYGSAGRILLPSVEQAQAHLYLYPGGHHVMTPASSSSSSYAAMPLTGRSHSMLDASGITRISPGGGAAFGPSHAFAFYPQHLQHHPQHQDRSPLFAQDPQRHDPSAFAAGGAAVPLAVTTGKLPSLHELPIAGLSLNRSSPPPARYTVSSTTSDYQPFENNYSAPHQQQHQRQRSPHAPYDHHHHHHHQSMAPSRPVLPSLGPLLAETQTQNQNMNQTQTQHSQSQEQNHQRGPPYPPPPYKQ